MMFVEKVAPLWKVPSQVVMGALRDFPDEKRGEVYWGNILSPDIDDAGYGIVWETAKGRVICVEVKKWSPKRGTRKSYLVWDEREGIRKMIPPSKIPRLKERLREMGIPISPMDDKAAILLAASILGII